MLRFFSFCFAALLGLSQLASAASISAVLMPTFADGNGNTTLTGYYQRDVPNLGTSQGFFGPIIPPDVNGMIVKESVQLSDGIASVRTDLNTLVQTGKQTFKLTTYAWFQYDPGVTGGAVVSDTYVQNRAYLEFSINGNYDWSILGSDPAVSSLGSDNRRSYKFVSVDGSNNETIIHQNTGFGVTNPSGTTEIGSGTYRLYFDHSDTYKYTERANAVNLDIAFTFKSEAGGGGGGVVPEPSSIAVFGLLSIGSAVAKWRRKKLQLAS